MIEKEGNYFSPDYQQARAWFVKAAQKAGAEVKYHAHPIAKSLGEKKIGIDVASFNIEEAHTIIVITSGVHGVEGFAGSAVQTGLFSENFMGKLPEGFGVLMVHAVNPYGFAFLRRFNEDNVDVNRNFIDFNNPPDPNDVYKNWIPLLERRSRKDKPRKKLAWQLKKKLLLTFIKGRTARVLGIAKGQMISPNGLYYMGKKASWSRETLTSIFDEHLKVAPRLVLLDIHTGIGKYYETVVLVGNDDNRETVKDWVDTDSSPRYKAPKRDVYINVRDIKKNWKDKCSLTPFFEEKYIGRDVISATIEFGVDISRLFPIDTLINLRDETWLHTCAGDCFPKDGHEAREIKERLKESFIPSKSDWKENVWDSGKHLFETLIKKLSAASINDK